MGTGRSSSKAVLRFVLSTGSRQGVLFGYKSRRRYDAWNPPQTWARETCHPASVSGPAQM